MNIARGFFERLDGQPRHRVLDTPFLAKARKLGGKASGGPSGVHTPALGRDVHPTRGVENGFTLLELFIGIVIFGVLLGALLVTFLVGSHSFLSGELVVQSQQEARRALGRLTKELRNAGKVNNAITIAAPGVQRLDFQIARGYDATTCGGICWGSDDTALPNGWIHYVLDATNPQHVRFVRCVTANRLDSMPAAFAGCQVLANEVDSALANTGFTYDDPSRMIEIRIQISIVSPRLPQSFTTPITTRIKLRNG